MGAIVGSEMTAAAAGKVGTLRRDPFAMLPFCGYNMGDYFSHWLKMGTKTEDEKLPKIFYVNWFRKRDDGSWLWPGYGENSRVIKWIFERIMGTGKAEASPIGYLPTSDALDVSGIDVKLEDIKELFKVDPAEWKKEVETIRQYFTIFGDHLPKELNDELSFLGERLADVKDR